MRLSKYRIENWTWVGQRTRWRASYPDMAASVVWVFFEPAREDGPLRYLAGVEFAGADPEIIEAFSVRHRQK